MDSCVFVAAGLITKVSYPAALEWYRGWPQKHTGFRFNNLHKLTVVEKQLALWRGSYGQLTQLPELWLPASVWDRGLQSEELQSKTLSHCRKDRPKESRWEAKQQT